MGNFSDLRAMAKSLFCVKYEDRRQQGRADD